MGIDDVPVGDIEAAMAFAQQAVRDGRWDGDVAEMLLNKQHDQRALMTRLLELPIVGAASAGGR
jgi:hypothetical protein